MSTSRQWENLQWEINAISSSNQLRRNHINREGETSTLRDYKNRPNAQSEPKRISRYYQKNKCSKREGGDKKRGTENTQRNRGERDVS